MARLRRLKTLHLTNSWHGSSGGIGTFYRALFEAANREGHRMRMVVPGATTRTEQIGRFGRVYYIQAPRAPLNRGYRILYPYRFLTPGTALQRILNEERPDLVEVCEKYTLPYFAGLLRTRRLPGVNLRPTVVGLSCERMDENMAAYLSSGKLARAFCAWYMKWVYFSSFDHHVTVSEHTAGELIDASRGHKVRRGLWVRPMGVDCDAFTPEKRSPQARARLQRRVGADQSATLLLYAGRLAPEKNAGLLLQTMARLDPRDYHLAIAGTGILLEPMRAACRRLGLRHVSFLGHIADRGELAECYANADVFVHPNPREPFGIAPLEALAAGLALVAPHAGGINSYANAGNAWLTDPQPEAFAAAVRAIRADPASAACRSAEGRMAARAYCWQNITRQYLELYRELHAITQGLPASSSLQARTWSTPGDAFGREIEISKGGIPFVR